MRIILLSLFLALSLCVQSQHFSSWTQVYQNPDSTSIHAIHFTDSLTGYMTTRSSILKSTDAGYTWNVIVTDTSWIDSLPGNFNWNILQTRDSLYFFYQDVSPPYIDSIITYVTALNNYNLLRRGGGVYDKYASASKFWNDRLVFIERDSIYGQNVIVELNLGQKNNLINGGLIRFDISDSVYLSLVKWDSIIGSAFYATADGVNWDTITSSNINTLFNPWAQTYFNGSDTLFKLDKTGPGASNVSYDRGLNWNTAIDQSFLGIEWHFLNNHDIYISNRGIFYYSSDCGVSFNADTADPTLLGSSNFFQSSDLYVRSANEVFLYTGLGKVFKANSLLTSIGNNEMDSEALLVYPNPSSGLVQIQVKGEKLINRLQLYDLEGSLLLDKDVNYAQLGLDLSSYPEGVYLIKINSEGKSYFHKIIKQ